MKVKLLNFQLHGDDRGFLVAIESNKGIPFDIQRIYYIYGNKLGKDRGFHAHKEVRQLAIALAGSCEIILDDGKSEKTVLLDAPTEGVLIDPYIWHHMRNFSPNCILLVIADQPHNECDYIRDYQEFISCTKKQ